MTTKSIIENIRMEVNKAENQTANVFSPYHVKYIVKIWHKGKKFQSSFQVPKEESVILEDFLFCIFSDIAFYENAKSLEDFNAELGYDTFDTFEYIRKAKTHIIKLKNKVNRYMIYLQMKK